MKKHWKLLTTSLIVTFNLGSLLTTQAMEATQGALVAAEAASAGILQTEFLPLVTVGDMKRYLAVRMCEVVKPYLLARVCKSWAQFILGRAFEAKAKNKITAVPFLPNSPSASWLEKRDVEKLNSGIFQYQPSDSAAFDVQLSTMHETNGNLVLPDKLAIRLCVMREMKTFVIPVGDNTSKALVLLTTLSKLKSVAQQISTDESFIQNVAQADLSQNAVCALIKYGDRKCGFKYTILDYREMNGLSIWQIYTHEKARAVEGAGHVELFGLNALLADARVRAAAPDARFIF